MVKCRGISRRASTLSQGLLVEVDDEEVTINRRDFHTNSWTGEPWKIKLPAKKETFTHVEDRDKEKPSFRQVRIYQYQM